MSPSNSQDKSATIETTRPDIFFKHLKLEWEKSYYIPRYYSSFSFELGILQLGILFFYVVYTYISDGSSERKGMSFSREEAASVFFFLFFLFPPSFFVRQSVFLSAWGKKFSLSSLSLLYEHYKQIKTVRSVSEYASIGPVSSLEVVLLVVCSLSL